MPPTTASSSPSESGSKEPPNLAELTLVSANLHWGYGYRRNDRRAYDVVDALLPLDADVLVLVEAFRPDDGHGMLEALAALGYRI